MVTFSPPFRVRRWLAAVNATKLKLGPRCHPHRTSPIFHCFACPKFSPLWSWANTPAAETMHPKLNALVWNLVAGTAVTNYQQPYSGDLATSAPFYPSPWMDPNADGWEDAYAKAKDFVSQLTLLEKVNLTTGTGYVHLCWSAARHKHVGLTIEQLAKRSVRRQHRGNPQTRPARPMSAGFPRGHPFRGLQLRLPVRPDHRRDV